MEIKKSGKDNNVPAKKTNKPTVNLLKDGTLIVNTDLYFEVKRVLVEHETNGTLYYVDNEKPTGKWKRTTPNYLKCTNCRKYICDIFRYNEMNYCPNCGAKMEGKINDR